MFDKLQHIITGTVVVMPDFFVDRIIKFNSKQDLFDALDRKAKTGGGSVRGFHTVDLKGGNAVNIAYCLSTLGIKTALFTVSDSVGLAILKQVFSKFGNNIDLQVSPGRHGFTTSFEFNERSSKVNVMVSDIGDNVDFGPDKITSQNLNILNNASAVVVVNWASNLRATDLADYVFRNSPKALHFIDPADFENRRYEFIESMIKLRDELDVISINENECNLIGSSLGYSMIIPDRYNSADVKNAARKIANKIGVEIDLHTRIGSAWSDGNNVCFADAFEVRPQTLTGAGDVWDAADIVGHLINLNPSERLIFSNACASLYIKSIDAEPPSMERVIEFLKSSYSAQ